MPAAARASSGNGLRSPTTPGCTSTVSSAL